MLSSRAWQWLEWLCEYTNVFKLSLFILNELEDSRSTFYKPFLQRLAVDTKSNSEMTLYISNKFTRWNHMGVEELD